MRKLKHALTLLLCMNLFSLYGAGPDAVRRVNVEEFAGMVGQTNTVLLDVRTAEEYSAGHLKNAVHIDFHSPEFDAKLAKLDKSKTYLVYCAGGGRSAMACKKMTKMDFNHLVDLAPGFSGWKRANKPVEK